MRTVDARTIADAVAQMYLRANLAPGEGVGALLRSAAETEEPGLPRRMLEALLENVAAAREDGVPLCQDTGAAVVFVTLGEEVRVQGGTLGGAIAEGIARACTEGRLRPSIVADPLHRTNTGDNTPPFVHYDLVPGDELVIRVAPKGGGAENSSALAMLSPGEGVEGVKRFVVETVAAAGPNACPPLVVGVGIGGTFDVVALLAKRAAIRDVRRRHPHPFYASLEAELLGLVNATGVGPGGLGGRTTALAVNVEVAPCHIASLPVAVNINCHATRYAEVRL